MTRSVKLISCFAALSLLGISGVWAGEIACSSDGSMNRCPLPGADKLNVKVKQILEGKCAHDKGWWADSDGVVVDKGCSAVFKYKEAKAKTTTSTSTTDGTDVNASAYYDDGCKAGKKDAKARLSMAYERHSDAYDTQNAGTFQSGYEKCWMKARK